MSSKRWVYVPKVFHLVFDRKAPGRQGRVDKVLDDGSVMVFNRQISRRSFKIEKKNIVYGRPYKQKVKKPYGTWPEIAARQCTASPDRIRELSKRWGMSPMQVADVLNCKVG